MGRSKKRKNKQAKNPIVQKSAVVTPNSFDYQKFTAAMVEAQKQVKEIERREENIETQNKQVEWEKILGCKEYPSSKYKIVNCFHSVLNYFKAFWKIMTFKKEDAKFDVATVIMLRFSISAMLGLIKVVLYFISIGLVVASFYSFAEKDFIPFKFSGILFSFVPCILARIIRMVQFEIENIHDRNYLIGILSSMASFIAIILAIIALMF